jgi:hypothetical protein
MSSMFPDQAQPAQLPAAGIVQGNPALQLAKNPMLPQSPMGQYIDSQYAADNAVLKSNIAKQYQDVLQQLGYVDPDTNQFVMGSVEAQANRQKAELNRQMGLADEGVTQQHQNLGTLFSGLRGTDQARAEQPMISGISDIDTQTPLTLSQLYEQGAGLMSDYTNQNNQLLAGAAARAMAGINAMPPDSSALPASGGPTDTAPPAAPSAPAGGYPFYTDPGVPGQTVGDYSPIPSLAGLPALKTAKTQYVGGPGGPTTGRIVGF